MKSMEEVTKYFPSIDGNAEVRREFVENVKYLLEKLDELKDPDRLTLGVMQERNDDYYQELIRRSCIPEMGMELKDVMDRIVEMSIGHRYVNTNYVANAAPLPSTPSLLGNLWMTLLNGNNLWEVEGSLAAQTEVAITSMLSKLVGYDPERSAGYTTWGGQGSVFHSLRLAMTRKFPASNKEGNPKNVYCFCSELAHYSLYKSMEAMGIGTNYLVKVRVKDDHSMDENDLRKKIEKVIQKGGIPLYVLATMGTTDTFGIDNIVEIKKVLEEIENKYGLEPIYLHADTAMGAMYAFFNDYDMDKNELGFEKEVLQVLENYQRIFKNLYLADSMVFDFHKLGYTPYVSSLFLIKDRMNLKYVDLEVSETPYVGNRGFGSYHTSYILECSRMGSSIPIYMSLLVFGIQGYQKLLGNLIRVAIEFRKKLKEEFKNVEVTNEISPVTTFRFYPEEVKWELERDGKLSRSEVEEINRYNEEFSDWLGKHRDKIYFGSTKKQRYVSVIDSNESVPVFAHKFFVISPYMSVDNVNKYIDHLKKHLQVFEKGILVKKS